MKLEQDVILNEIANIIVARPDLAISNLVKAGIDIKPDATEQEIADAYQQNLYKKELAKLTALEIAAGNKNSFDGKEYGRKFFNDDGGKGADYAGLATSVVNLGVAIGGAVKDKKDRQRAERDAKKEAKNTRLQDLVASKSSQIASQIAALTAQKNKEKSKSTNKTLFMVLGIGAGVLIVGAIVAYAISQRNVNTATAA